MLEPSDFLAAIRTAGVMAPDAERALVAWYDTTHPDTPALAKHIHENHWLTSFQIQRIHNRKGHRLRVGPYTLLAEIGEGGMGRVYRAKHSRIGREVALKVIRKERLGNPVAIRRFQQEVRAAGQMMHPNIVLAFDADSHDLLHYVAMELIDGSDLKKLVVDHGPMPMHVACEYIRQAAVGLQYAYEQGMVHRDVKPSNLMVTRQGVVKVLDLGLAMLRDAEAREAETRMTQVNQVLGTPDYLAPEQARDASHVDTRADIYALGGTLFYLLAGRIPYDAPSPAAKLLRHATEPPPSLRVARPDLPPQLESVVHWLMAKRPEQRAQEPLQVAIALQAYCQPFPPAASIVGTTSAPPVESTARRRPARRGASLFPIIAVAASLIVVVIAITLLKKLSYW